MRKIARTLIFAAGCVALSGCRSTDRPAAATTTTTVSSPPAAATPEAHSETVDRRPAIVALGDSLTAGYNLPESQSYPARLQARLDALGANYRVVNAGVSGETSAQGLNRLQVVLDMMPRIVIVELGPNDGLRGLPLDSTRGNLAEIIQRCQKVGARVVLAGMTLPPNYGPAYIRAFEEMYSDLAKAYRTPLIPFFLEGVAARPELNLQDQMHPNAAGYEIVVDNVMKVLKPML